ncbi:MAG: methionine--tRNA ligase [Chrysiogenetes bacterium]|nr:methionine--tRNA ligase [Chrysiogenetes bacterium]
MDTRPFLVTTPIYYVNDVPHIGHAYTTIACDAIARFQRMMGREVFFLTGTDEHGKKIEEAAGERGKTAQQLADEVVVRFKEMWERLGISNDGFVRTTDQVHKDAVQVFWKAVADKGGIYPGEYEGLYCTGCEAYYTEKELEDGNCPVHKTPATKLKEKSYFFKMSEHGKWLAEQIRGNEDFIQPESRRNEILSFVDEGLKDLSISRTTFAWGVPVPGDPEHVVYVWFDALLNYMTGLGYPEGPDYKKFWSEDAEVLHMVGKDILRFHTVYWPTMLHGAGHRQPSQVYAHGWWTVEGQKMSKSLRNVVDPGRLVDKYGVDEVRYFLLREVPFGDDGNFSHEALTGRIIGELANTVGNLANRVIPLVLANFPEAGALREAPKKPIPDLERDLVGPKTTFAIYAKEMKRLAFSVAIEEILSLARNTNDFIQQSAPWKLAKDETKGEELAWVFEQSLLSLQAICLGLYPFLPTKMALLWKQLGNETPIDQVVVDLKDGPTFEVPAQVEKGAPLFARKEDVEAVRDAFLSEVSAAGAEEKAAAKEAGPAQITFEDFMGVELRVARVDAAFAIPKANKLLRLEVDLGDEQRQIVAGIAKSYQPDDLIGRKVVIVANLKPAKLMGLESQGMVLAAETSDGKLVLVDPGEGAKVGARVK